MNYDLVICGAGPAGCAAAIKAGRGGLKVCLVERYGFPGGMATAGLVNPFLGHKLYHSDGQLYFLSSPVFAEIVEKLRACGAYGSMLLDNAFDDEQLKFVLDEMLVSAGVTVLYHTMLTGVQKKGRVINSVEVFSKKGKEIISGKQFIDATGDGDLGAMVECEFEYGRPGDHFAQPMTTSFRMANIDKETLSADGSLSSARALVEEYFQNSLTNGSLDYTARDFVQFYDYPRKGVLHFNMTRVNKTNGLDNADLTASEIEGRRQVKTITDWLVKTVPYFKDACLIKLPAQIGVRETRHIKCLYQMDQQDVTQGSKFNDGIARSAYGIDIHSPIGNGFDHSKAGTKGKFLPGFLAPADDYYEVPYRSIQPVAFDNMLIACRALCATHEALAAVRVMATMASVGEAAGLAAVMARKQNGTFADVSGKKLRTELKYMDEAPTVIK